MAEDQKKSWKMMPPGSSKEDAMQQLREWGATEFYDYTNMHSPENQVLSGSVSWMVKVGGKWYDASLSHDRSLNLWFTHPSFDGSLTGRQAVARLNLHYLNRDKEVILGQLHRVEKQIATFLPDAV